MGVPARPMLAVLVPYRTVGVEAQHHVHLFGAAGKLEAGWVSAFSGMPGSARLALVAQSEVGRGSVDEPDKLADSCEMVRDEVSFGGVGVRC